MSQRSPLGIDDFFKELDELLESTLERGKKMHVDNEEISADLCEEAKMFYDRTPVINYSGYILQLDYEIVHGRVREFLEDHKLPLC